MGRRLRHLLAALASGVVAAILAGPGAAADVAACASPELGAPASEQRAAMLCLVNELRRSHDLTPLAFSPKLDRAARLKASAIARCGTFSHTPCGRSFASTFVEVGYAVGSWQVGENLAWGSGEGGSAARIFDQLRASSPHLANFLRRGWRDIGIAVRRGALFGRSGVALWVIDFGRR
jgi:uncharacterized protein YkwD